MEDQQTHTTFDLWITSHKKSYEKPQKPQTFSKSHTFVQDHDRHMVDQAGQNDSNSEGLYDGFDNTDLVLFIPYPHIFGLLTRDNDVYVWVIAARRCCSAVLGRQVLFMFVPIRAWWFRAFAGCFAFLCNP